MKPNPRELVKEILRENPFLTCEESNWSDGKARRYTFSFRSTRSGKGTEVFGMGARQVYDRLVAFRNGLYMGK